MTDLDPAVKNALTACVAHWRDSDLDEFVNLERGRPGYLHLLLEPASEVELAALIEALRAHRVSTATIAGQSGLVEAQRPHGVAISMKRFDRIVELILPDGRQVAPPEFATVATTHATPDLLRGAQLRVEAGVAIDTINTALAPTGLKMPIVMGSTATASAGACAANGSAGANAVRYGTAADLVRHVRGVLGTGEIVAEDLAPRPDARDRRQCAIRADRFSHGESLVGSQGALGLITEVTYEVFPVPRDQAVALLPMPDLATADLLFEHLTTRFDGPGQALELFEVIAQPTLERALVHAEQNLRDGVGQAPYYVLCLITADTPSGPSVFGSAFVEELVEFLMTGAAGPGVASPWADGNFDVDHDPRRLLHLREACSEMSRLLPKQSYDVVVPAERLADFVAAVEHNVATRHPELVLSLFGHVGVGALHLHAIAPDIPTLDRQRDDLDRQVFDLVQAHDGSPWAEHGVGSKWGVEWRRRTPPDIIEAMLHSKRRCDPDNVLGSRLFGFDQMLGAPVSAD